MRRNQKPASPIFRNERERFESEINNVINAKSRLPASVIHRLVAREMTRRPAHVLLMRSEQTRVEMLMERICPAIWRAERKAGLR